MERKMKGISGQELSFIGKCFLNDLNIENRIKKKSIDLEKNINKLVQIFSTHTNDASIAYNAFDGDHFHFLQAMRKFSLKYQRIPANPESILGYRNVVSRYQSKYGVLLDDLAILQGCDELWVFTDYTPNIEDVLKLPEGVLIEIAFFLKRRVSPTVYFVPISGLVMGNKIKYIELDLKFEQLEAALMQTERSEVIDMANNNFKIDNDLKNLVFYITDPLDYKYSEWLRDGQFNALDEIALIPGLAVRVNDLDPGFENLGRIVLSWAILLKKLSKKKAFYLDSFDEKRSFSVISESLKKYCIQLKGSNYLEMKKWSSFNIPKSLQKNKWPITKFEQKNL